MSDETIIQAHETTMRVTEAGCMVIEFRVRDKIVAEAHLLDPDYVIAELARCAEEAQAIDRLHALVDEEAATNH